MAAFVLAVIVDGQRLGQEWMCLCLGKLWEDLTEAQVLGFQADAPVIFGPLLSQSHPEVRAASIFALGTLLDFGFDTSRDDIGGVEDYDDEEKNEGRIHNEEPFKCCF